MGLFRRRAQTDEEVLKQQEKKEKVPFLKRPASASLLRLFHFSNASHSPLADTAFKQQRLKAWQPILTPATVLPTFFLVGIIFVPLGGVLLWGSNQVRRLYR